MTGMQRKTQRIVAAVAAMAALPAFALATAPSASAGRGDTPDNHWTDADYWPNNRGYVMWNDYKDSDHSYDLDDLWIRDKKGDGDSIELRVYRNGKIYKTARARYGETKKVYIWNVRNGEKVFWDTCAHVGGGKYCTDIYYFQE